MPSTTARPPRRGAGRAARRPVAPLSVGCECAAELAAGLARQITSKPPDTPRGSGRTQRRPSTATWRRSSSRTNPELATQCRFIIYDEGFLWPTSIAYSNSGSLFAFGTSAGVVKLLSVGSRVVVATIDASHLVTDADLAKTATCAGTTSGTSTVDSAAPHLLPEPLHAAGDAATTQTAISGTALSPPRLYRVDHLDFIDQDRKLSFIVSSVRGKSGGNMIANVACHLAVVNLMAPGSNGPDRDGPPLETTNSEPSAPRQLRIAAHINISRLGQWLLAYNTAARPLGKGSCPLAAVAAVRASCLPGGGPASDGAAAPIAVTRAEPQSTSAAGSAANLFTAGVGSSRSSVTPPLSIPLIVMNLKILRVFAASRGRVEHAAWAAAQPQFTSGAMAECDDTQPPREAASSARNESQTRGSQWLLDLLVSFTPTFTSLESGLASTSGWDATSSPSMANSTPFRVLWDIASDTGVLAVPLLAPDQQLKSVVAGGTGLTRAPKELHGYPFRVFQYRPHLQSFCLSPTHTRHVHVEGCGAGADSWTHSDDSNTPYDNRDLAFSSDESGSETDTDLIYQTAGSEDAADLIGTPQEQSDGSAIQSNIAAVNNIIIKTELRPPCAPSTPRAPVDLTDLAFSLFPRRGKKQKVCNGLFCCVGLPSAQLMVLKLPQRLQDLAAGSPNMCGALDLASSAFTPLEISVNRSGTLLASRSAERIAVVRVELFGNSSRRALDASLHPPAGPSADTCDPLTTTTSAPLEQHDGFTYQTLPQFRLRVNFTYADAIQKTKFECSAFSASVQEGLLVSSDGTSPFVFFFSLRGAAPGSVCLTWKMEASKMHGIRSIVWRPSYNEWAALSMKHGSIAFFGAPQPTPLWAVALPDFDYLSSSREVIEAEDEFDFELAASNSRAGSSSCAASKEILRPFPWEQYRSKRWFSSFVIDSSFPRYPFCSPPLTNPLWSCDRATKKQPPGDTSLPECIPTGPRLSSGVPENVLSGVTKGSGSESLRAPLSPSAPQQQIACPMQPGSYSSAAEQTRAASVPVNSPARRKSLEDALTVYSRLISQQIFREDAQMQQLNQVDTVGLLPSNHVSGVANRDVAWLCNGFSTVQEARDILFKSIFFGSKSGGSDRSTVPGGGPGKLGKRTDSAC